MHKRQVLISMFALCLLAALVAGMGQAQAQNGGVALRSPSAGGEFSLQDWTSTTLPYTARLENDLGQPVPDGEYAFSFSVYADQTGGHPLWQELQEGVPIQRGSVSISLGSLAPIPLALLDGRSLWLEVSVRGASDAAFTALTPRQRLNDSTQASPSAASSCLHDHFGETWSGSSNTQGLAITNTGLGNGLQVNQAGGAGVYVSSAGTDGVQVSSAGSDGFYVNTAGSAGVYVSSAGTDGIYVGSAVSNGMHVSSAETNGVFVGSAGSHGVSVSSAGDDGVHVGSTGANGVHVTSAGNDGVYVHQAGSPNAVDPSTYWNGFEVAGAEGSGLWVGHADLDGVTVESADWYGLYVMNSNSDGVRVESAGGDGVVATSTNPIYYGGRFRNSAAGGTGLYAAGGDNTAADLVLGTYGAGDDGRIYSEPDLTGSDLLLFSNDEAHIHLDEDINSDSAFIIYNGTNAAVFQVDETPKVTVAGPLVTWVDTQDYGTRAAYAMQSTGNWYEDFGTAQLVSGAVAIPIDPIFAQVVNLAEYHVFLTPLGDCPLYVAEKTPAAFAVRAMGGQTCSISFDYRIVAERLGSEGLHLEQVVTSLEDDD